MRMNASRRLLARWGTYPDTDEAFDAFLARSRMRSEERYLVRRTEDDAIAGVFSVGQIFYGSLCSAYLGYWALVPFAGQGYMREGIGLVQDVAFGTLGLHRLEANIQPENARSIALVRAAGFHREGFSPRYLRINGRWRDHERWAITVEDRAVAVRRRRTT
jgi:[ribosomal protein S5]-alanine N-acetyltransferase